MNILLDAGHGMGNRVPGVYDSGALGPDGAQEADYALGYALKVEQELVALGATVQMTRRDATTPCSLLYRIRMYRQVKPDLFCSIHFNASARKGPKDGKVRGFEVLWRMLDSKPIAENVAGSLAAAGREHLNPYTLERPDLLVLSSPKSILVEIGFIDDPDDLELISDSDWSYQTCKVLAGALTSYLGRGPGGTDVGGTGS